MDQVTSSSAHQHSEILTMKQKPSENLKVASELEKNEQLEPPETQALTSINGNLVKKLEWKNLKIDWKL